MIKILPQIILGLWGIQPGNYSGITHVKDNVYAVVDDKDKVDGFKLLTLDIDSVTAKVRNASMVEPNMMSERRAKGVATNRDCEGIAYFSETKTLFVSGEEDQRILEYSLDGSPTGRELQIPIQMQRDKIAHNLGFEALTYNEKQERFWTTTESTLLADGERASAKNNDVHNLLRFISFNNALQPETSYIYTMDKPEARKKSAKSIIGVPSLIALDDGRLIVMEREGCFPKKEYGSWVKIKLYMVNPVNEKPVSMDTQMQSLEKDSDGVPLVSMHKELLGQFTTHLRIGQMNLSNYEGMCLGPRLADGRQTIILIADSQNGMGNWLYHIKDHIRIIII